MINKNMLLSILLIPLTVIGNNATSVLAKELNKKLLEKELELSKLGEMIAQREVFLSSFDSEGQYLLKALVDKKIKLIEKNIGKSLSDDEREKLSHDLANSAIVFVNNFCIDYENRKDIRGVLSNALIKGDGDLASIEFDSFSFYLIRCIAEWSILKKLLSEYENCLLEIRDLEDEIKLNLKTAL